MAWTTPRTWVTGELVTAVILNTYVRDNQIALDTFVGGQDLTANRILIGAGTSSIVATGDGTLNGDLTVVGTGPHVIGGSTVDYVRLGLSGAFTSGGASDVAFGTYTSGALTGHSGDSAAIAGTKLDNSVVTAGSCTTIAQLWISEPQITVGSGSVTNSAAIYVEGAASEATNDLGIWVDSGDVLIDDDLKVGSQVMIGGATSGGTIPLGIATNQTTNVPCIDIANATSGTYSQGIHVMLASIGTGHAVGLAVGKAHSAKNDATFGYKHAGDGSDANYAFVGGHSNDDALKVFMNGLVDVPGTFTAGTKTFRIPHPLPSLAESHLLTHASIEGPQADLIYRGSVTLVDGGAEVNLDSASEMTEGTWVILCRDEQCFTSNETGWSSVRGSVAGNILTIECEDATSTDTISWMVVAERHDPNIYDSSLTDEDGHIIVESEVPQESDEDDEDEE